MKRMLGLGSLALVLGGCSHPAIHVTNASPPQLDSGWTMADDSEDGVKLGIPGGWRVGVDTATSTMGLADQAASDSAPSMNPDDMAQQLTHQLQGQDEAQQKEALAKLREKGIVVNVIDSSKPIPGEVRNQFYVKKQDHSGNWTLEQARDDEIEYYKGWGADAPTLVNLPIGKAYKFSSDYKTRGGDEVMRISYVVVDGKETYMLRFVSTNNPDIVKTIADPVAQTWRIKPGVG